MDTLIPKNGNYKQLLSYQKSQAIYDMTFYFCTNYIRRTDRTLIKWCRLPQRETEYCGGMRSVVDIKQERNQIDKCG